MKFRAGLAAAAAIWCASGMAASGQGLSGGDDFSFRRIKVSAPGSGPRITVQIDPAEQARRLALMPKPEPKAKAGTETAAAPPLSPPEGAAPGSAYGWFWDLIPPARDAVAGRFPSAIAALSRGPGGATVRGPRLQHLQEVARTYGTEILKATVGTSVSPALVLAVMAVESAGRADAVSSAGATGLMQLIPATATRFGVTDATDPGQNIRGGVAYLDWLLREFDRDPLMVLAAYNAGEGAVQRNGGVPPYAETRDYVPKVLAAWQVAQGLCLSPPELVTDPCVFNVISAAKR